MERGFQFPYNPPLMELDESIKNLLVDELPFEDMMSLACTSKYWWKLCNELPRDRKKVIPMDLVTLDDDSFVEVKKDKSEKIRRWNSSFSNVLVSKISIRRLEIKGTVSLKAVNFLKTSCEIETLVISLPINCPKDLIEPLQRISCDTTVSTKISFQKSVEDVDEFSLDVDGFVDFLELPVIRLEFEADDSSINKLLKQWINNERPMFEGLYSVRSGKVDKLDKLLNGLDQFSTEKKTNFMGIFFHLVVPDVGRLSVAYTTTFLSIEVDANCQKEKDCLMTKLDRNIQLNILKKLEFRDFVNLALTCHKWFEAASNAPSSMKPVLTVDVLQVTNNFKATYNNKESRDLTWTFETSFNLVKRVDCNRLRVAGLSEHSSEASHTKAYNHIIKYRSFYRIEGVFVLYPTYFEQNLELVKNFCDLASGIHFDIAETFAMSSFDAEQQWAWQRCLFMYLVLHDHSYIFVQVPQPFHYINKCLQQWIEGRRPNLKFFRCIFMARGGDPLEEVVKGLERHVIDKSDLFGARAVQIVSPTGKHLTILHAKDKIIFYDGVDIKALGYVMDSLDNGMESFLSSLLS